MEMLKEKLQQKVGNVNDQAEIITLPNSTHLLSNVHDHEERVTNDKLLEFAQTIDQAKESLIMLQEFIKVIMIPGQDYGIIPKCDKPTLLKSGAEKLTDIYGLSKKIEVINRVENWDQGFFHYEIKTSLINKRTGLLEAEGIGSCNTKEKKYSNVSPFNLINTVLKMAKKRSFVDAVLSATRSSGLFSQDLEDGIPTETSTETVNLKVSNIKTPEHKNSTVTRNQLNLIQSLVSNKSLSIDSIRHYMMDTFSVKESKQLTVQQADEFIKYLKNV